MRWGDHIANELTESLSEAITSGYLTREDPGFALAAKVRDHGIGSLTDTERDIFEREIWPLLESFEQRKLEDTGRDELERPE